ncbi:MAG TPA: CARDB domain-containing protein [Thermoleophilaceae bacterium]|nr:CARDB domain-containing protein [Thermoleophilaceae bacterium]
MRRTIAIGGGLVVLILLVFAFRGCLDARQERAMEDYVRGANELTKLSRAESVQLFDILSAPSSTDQTINRRNQANALRVDSATLSDRVHALSVPDELSEANRYLVEALDLRRDGLAEVADQLAGALAEQDRRNSTGRIADMMRVFSASDVLLTARFEPSARDALKKQGVSATINKASLSFVQDPQWLDPTFVADQIASIRGTGGGSATPGTHGDGLGTVSLGGVALTPGVSATVPLTSDIAFDVQVLNQGESTETDVQVQVTVGQGSDAIKAEDTIPEIAAGEQKPVTIPLTKQPPTGQNVPITVRVKPVPGEQVTDNNVGEFTVIFTR